MNLVNAVVTANRSEADSTYFAFDFFATSVNAVLGNSEPTPAGAGEDGHLVVVELDGRPLSQDEAGADIEWDSAGNSVVRVKETRLYQIAALPEFGKHELKLTTNSEGLAVYTITFGIFEFGP